MYLGWRIGGVSVEKDVALKEGEEWWDVCCYDFDGLGSGVGRVGLLLLLVSLASMPDGITFRRVIRKTFKRPRQRKTKCEGDKA